MKAELIAQVAHEVNKAYCEFLGDKSQVNWEDTPDNIKDSAIDGVQFHLDNPGVTPEDSHDNWKKFKAEDGWVYGKTKDAKKKTHPCMVIYSKLPRDQRIKDVLFQGVVGSLSKIGVTEAPQDLREVLESIARLEATVKAATVPEKPKKPKVPRVYPSRARVVQRPKGQKGFAQPADVIRKAAVTNTNDGSGGTLNGPPKVTMEPSEPLVTPKKSGLISSDAGDGAAAEAMMSLPP